MVSRNDEVRLEDFGIASERGFLSNPDPLTEMPNGWEYLDQVGNALPELLESGGLFKTARVLPIPSLESLNKLNQRELLLAWVRYSFIQSAYVYGRTKSEDSAVICRNIAIPVIAISKMLDVPPILQYFPYTLTNWKRKDPSGSIKVDNLELIQTFSRDSDQSWFNLIHVDIEYEMALALRSIYDAVLEMVPLEQAFTGIRISLEQVVTTMKRMPEGTNPETYYKIRRWIMPFKNVFYEGVLEQPGVLLRGQSGAMTSSIQALEAGLQMPELEENELAKTLKDFRNYMLKGHREFINYLETYSSVRKRTDLSGSSSLIGQYDDCVEKILEFLSMHKGYAYYYIKQQTGDSMGTGNTNYLEYLGGRIKERWDRAFIKPRTESDFNIFAVRIDKMVRELLAA